MKIYISGKITGTTDYKERFARAEEMLKSRGHEVVNPCHIDDGGETKPWEWYMKRCIPLLTECDGIYLLKGWSESRGARLEWMVAKGLGMNVLTE